MKLLTSGLKWFTAVAVAVAGIGLGGGSLIAPDPAFAKFEVDKLTIGGDIRVRGEFRRGATFGTIDPAAPADNNRQFVQQKTRLRVNYDVSPDVYFFVEMQDSRNWGAPTDIDNLGSNQNSVHGTAFGVRETYIGVKNGLVRNLNWKLGRQKVIFGNHRLLGHFDWNNVGFSLDGIRADYSMAKSNHTLGWFRLSERNCGSITAGGCGVGGTALGVDRAAADADLFVFYNTFKMVPGMTIEPYYFLLLDNRNASATATTKTGRVQPNQKRHFFGTRIDGKAVNKMIDYTAEFVWQTGNQFDAVTTGALERINAWAGAVKGGVTFQDMMWKPRIGFEVDYASGSGATGAGRHTVEGLFPTNHLQYGYRDATGWINMVDYSPQLLVRPDKASSLKVNLHILRLASTKDNWYGAGQGPTAVTRPGNQAASLGKEIDIVYTRKFKEGKFGMQVGYGHFFTGEYHARSQDTATQGGTVGGDPLGNTSQDWGYLQFTTKF